MTIRDWLDNIADEGELDLLVMDGFDECIVGIVEEAGEDPKAVYDRELVIDNLAKEMGYEDAREYHDFNQTSQPGVVFLDRPGFGDGVDDDSPPVPWWHGAAWTGLMLGTGVVVVAWAAWVSVSVCAWLRIPILYK